MEKSTIKIKIKKEKKIQINQIWQQPQVNLKLGGGSLSNRLAHFPTGQPFSAFAQSRRLAEIVPRRFLSEAFYIPYIIYYLCKFLN